jgi:PilZ domain
MKERRRAPRHRCRLRAEIRRGGQREEASLLDVSLSGLSLQAGVALAQGEPVELTIEGQVRVKALAWHAHRLKRPGPAAYKIGMMLAEVDADYETLVARVAAARPAPRRAPPVAAATAAPVAIAPAPSIAPAASRSAGTSATDAAPPRIAAAPGASPSPRRGAPPVPSKRHSWWRLRIKEKAGSRSRVVTLAAASKEAAVAGSLAEAGPGWEVLDVVATS